jgi:uncharacterized protein DUF1189
MRRYGIFHPPALSFYSRSLYRDVAENWTGIGFLYLLLLLAVCWIPPIVKFHRTTSGVLDTLGPAVLQQVPTITIKAGEVSIQEPQPYSVTVPGSDTPLLVIDTTGASTPENTQAFFLLTRNQLAVRKNPRETRLYSLAGVQDLTLDRASAERALSFCKRYLAFFSYPVALLGSYAYRILQALIYAAIGILFANLVKAPLEFPQLLRLACVAMTPAVLADTLRGILGYPSSLLWLFACFLLAMGYLLFAVSANTHPDALEREGSPPPPPMTGPALG